MPSLTRAKAADLYVSIFTSEYARFIRTPSCRDNAVLAATKAKRNAELVVREARSNGSRK